MANDMIERVARTLRKLTIANGGACRGNEDTGWCDYIDDAKAVVAAMRSPTMDMVDAVHDSGAEMLHPRGSVEPRLIWCTMIDTALKERL